MDVKKDMLVRNYRIYSKMYQLTGSHFYLDTADKFMLILEIEDALAEHQEDICPMQQTTELLRDFESMLDSYKSYEENTLLEEFYEVMEKKAA